MTTPVIDISGVTKQYGGLRPLRIERLNVSAGQQLALMGFDQPAAEVLINLLTGAALPDTGTVAMFGQPTTSIDNSDAWLAALDRYGIVSDRAAILEGMSVIQNLAMPFTLDIDPPPDHVRAKAEELAGRVEIPREAWDRPCHGLNATDRFRLRLARALALRPQLLILEHPSASLTRTDVAPLARAVRAITTHATLTTISLTMDKDWAANVAPITVAIDPATGRQKEGLLARMGFKR